MKSGIIICFLAMTICGCALPAVKLFTDTSDPLTESVLEGTAREKILVVSIDGEISTSPKSGLLKSKPAVVQEVVSRLRIAEKDKDIKAILLKIDSPGGGITASDILYNEIARLKEKTGVTVVAVMMGLAASGGYYIALPADRIVAHPTTVTGSVGVIFMRPMVSGLMQKIGVDVEVSKSGKNKDMGSFFRPSTTEENRILQDLTSRFGERFLSLVKKHRGLSDSTLENIATARIYIAEEALDIGLIDQIGYIPDALAETRKIAGLPEDCRVVVYRRSKYPDDNFYNTAGATAPGAGVINLDLPGNVSRLQTGFYYMWLPQGTY